MFWLRLSEDGARLAGFRPAKDLGHERMSPIKDGQYWRARADEVRMQADMLDEESRQTLLAIAASYERLADRRAKEANETGNGRGG